MKTTKFMNALVAALCLTGCASNQKQQTKDVNINQQRAEETLDSLYSHYGVEGSCLLRETYPFDENYNSLIDCSKILAAMRKNRRETGCGSFSNRKNAESTIAERIAEDNAAAASIMQAHAFPEIMETGNLVHDERTAKKIRICSIIRRPGRANIAMRSFSAILLLPLAIAWSIPSMPIAIADLLAERLLKDKAFINTFRFMGFAVAWPVLFIAYAAILFSVMRWQLAALACAIILPAPYCIYRYGRFVSILLSDIRFRRNKRLTMLLERLEKYFSGIL